MTPSFALILQPVVPVCFFFLWMLRGLWKHKVTEVPLCSDTHTLAGRSDDRSQILGRLEDLKLSPLRKQNLSGSRMQQGLPS